MESNHKLSDVEVNLFNDRLADKYGKTDNKANYRIVWSEDEFEKRITNYTDSGMQLLTPEVRLLPKYRQYIQDKHILERLTVVPHFKGDGGLVTPLSYEPIWVFENNKGDPLVPTWHAIAFIVENLIHAMEHPYPGAKYKDPETDPKEGLAVKDARLRELEKDLFANETEVGDALAHGDAIVVPTKYGD